MTVSKRIHQSSTGRSPDLQTVRLLRDAAHLILQDFASRAKNYELTFLQWRILGELDKSDGWTQSELARQLETDKMAVNRELERLEAAKLIRRAADASDARIRRVFRTAKLVKSFGDMDQIMEHTYAVAFGGLSAAQRAQFGESLSQIVARLQASISQLLAPQGSQKGTSRKRPGLLSSPRKPSPATPRRHLPAR